MARTSQSSVSNRDLYESLENLRKELSGNIQRLDDKFMQLEAGRLTRAEANINDLRVDILKATDGLKQNQAVLSGKMLILWAIANIILIGLSQAFFYKVGV